MIEIMKGDHQTLQINEKKVDARLFTSLGSSWKILEVQFYIVLFPTHLLLALSTSLPVVSLSKFAQSACLRTTLASVFVSDFVLSVYRVPLFTKLCFLLLLLFTVQVYFLRYTYGTL